MTKSNHTQKTLLTSALSIVLCFMMLLGTTFAWFTANKELKSTGINIGSIGVDLVDDKGASLSGPLKFYTDEACTVEAGKWQPGETYYLPKFYVKNSSDLDMIYTVTIATPTGLPAVITWNGATGETGVELAANTTSATATQISAVFADTATDADFTTSGKSFESGVTITVEAHQVNEA